VYVAKRQLAVRLRPLPRAGHPQYCRDGGGRRDDPYRYWLPHKSAQLDNDVRWPLPRSGLDLATSAPAGRRRLARPTSCILALP